MATIHCFGASGTVTGSCYFLQSASSKGILIDYGLFQGPRELQRRNHETLPIHPQDIEAVMVTHAHLDHIGRLPLLRRLGFRGPIYMTEATYHLLELTLMDAVRIQQEDRDSQLYNDDDVRWVLKHTVVCQYGDTLSTASFTVIMRNAGHILGSASLDVYSKNDGLRYVFSGDIGNYPEPLLPPPDPIAEADVVVMETTYGDRSHNALPAIDILAQEAEKIVESQGALLIPAFSIERTQELLYMFDQLHKQQRMPGGVPVFLDSTLGVRVTHVYQRFRTLYNQALKQQALTDDPFTFPDLHLIERARQSEIVDAFPGAKIVIAGSGMMTGGRILRHAKEYLPDPKTRILFVGFQGEGTLGRAILSGQSEVVIDRRSIPVRATVRKCSSLSSHADKPKLLDWLTSIQQTKQLVLTHGENSQRAAFRETVSQKLSLQQIHLPEHHQRIDISAAAPTKVVYMGSSSGSRRRSKAKSEASRYTYPFA